MILSRFERPAYAPQGMIGKQNQIADWLANTASFYRA